MRHRIFEIEGSPAEVAQLVKAIDFGDFPWERIASKLPAKFGRGYIPIKLSDLSRYASRVRVYRDDPFPHDHRVANTDGHAHGDAEFHILEARHRVLGLYWLDGRVEVERSLDRPLRIEVTWAEGAHLVDDAWMTDDQRDEIGHYFHPDGADDHPWWEKESYSKEYNFLLGEAFMAAFVQAYTTLTPTLQLHHVATDELGMQVRRLLTPELVEPQYCGCRWSKVFHRCGAHRYTCGYAKWYTAQEAVAAGRRPCRRCLG